MTKDLRTFATFKATFPDDGEFGNRGEILRPAGRNVSTALREMITREGLAASEPQQHSFYGWEFTASCNGFKLWFLLQTAGDWLLITRDTTGLVERLIRKTTWSHRRVLEALNRLLANDPRFGEATWYTRGDYESRQSVGFPNP